MLPLVASVIRHEFASSFEEGEYSFWLVASYTLVSMLLVHICWAHGNSSELVC